MPEALDADSRPLTVYAVSSGSYSDYRIDRVFSTEALAESYRAARMAADAFYRGEVEAWPVDTAFDPDLKCYTVMIHHRTGEAWVEGVGYDEMWYMSPTRFIGDLWHNDERQPWWNVVVWARDEDAAIKTAAERVTMKKAQMAGVS
jgi:hypothetical protein